MKTLSLAAAALLSILVAANASACITFQNAFNPTYKGNANWDLNDYGRIHHDADDPNCAQAAMYSLTDKLNQHLDANPTTFQQWLDGFLVAEIYASAMRIGANGWASQGLDDQLVELSGRFQHNVAEPSGVCGGDNFNTCMDDLTGTASAYAWMAAYMSRRPNRFTQQQVNAKMALAEEYLHKALKPVSATEPKNGICLRDKPVTSGSYTPLCTGTLYELSIGTAETFTVNGQQQMLHYGFGLMTSVASAKLGLELAGSSFFFTDPEKLVAKALMEEVQRHYDVNTHHYNDPGDCVQRKVTNGVVSYPLVDCGAGYLPDMYALRGFYDSRLGGVPIGNYDSNAFNPNLFRLDDQSTVMPDGVTRVDKEHFSYGRFETYGIQGYAWWVSSRTWMPGDASDPRGWVDGISSTGVATGWACDPDMPTGRTLIDFYADNGTTYVGTATANQYSGTMYNSECVSGTAHRFSYQLPWSSKGKLLRAWALDYTWYGTWELGCSQSPTCSW
ncbi:MAG TPA: hypothetical protein VND45_16155 [Thermoanaerobaculia bacterium]|nr:hypothetical protein [Thermoanaerobaculia bacterium]